MSPQSSPAAAVPLGSAVPSASPASQSGMLGCRDSGIQGWWDAGQGCFGGAAGAALGKSFLPRLPSKAIPSQTIVIMK